MSFSMLSVNYPSQLLISVCIPFDLPRVLQLKFLNMLISMVNTISEMCITSIFKAAEKKWALVLKCWKYIFFLYGSLHMPKDLNLEVNVCAFSVSALYRCELPILILCKASGTHWLRLCVSQRFSVWIKSSVRSQAVWSLLRIQIKTLWGNMCLNYWLFRRWSRHFLANYKIKSKGFWVELVMCTFLL